MKYLQIYLNMVILAYNMVICIPINLSNIPLLKTNVTTTTSTICNKIEFINLVLRPTPTIDMREISIVLQIVLPCIGVIGMIIIFIGMRYYCYYDTDNLSHKEYKDRINSIV